VAINCAHVLHLRALHPKRLFFGLRRRQECLCRKCSGLQPRTLKILTSLPDIWPFSMAPIWEKVLSRPHVFLFILEQCDIETILNLRLLLTAIHAFIKTHEATIIPKIPAATYTYTRYFNEVLMGRPSYLGAATRLQAVPPCDHPRRPTRQGRNYPCIYIVFHFFFIVLNA
jgi:hypothetical protein